LPFKYTTCAATARGDLRFPQGCVIGENATWRKSESEEKPPGENPPRDPPAGNGNATYAKYAATPPAGGVGGGAPGSPGSRPPPGLMRWDADSVDRFAALLFARWGTLYKPNAVDP
jgi:hypothetical protein